MTVDIFPRQVVAELEALVERLHSNIQSILKNAALQSRCKSCGKDVFYLMHRNGKTGIYNPDGVSHFATCTNADEHRKRVSRG